MNDTHQPAVPLSRRERRELHRMERRSEQGKGVFRRRARRVLIWGSGLALLAAFGWGMVKLADDVQLPSDNGVLVVPVSETDNVTGPADAPITLVEYSDFQCPACGAFHPLVKQLLADPEAASKVRFVYRNFPLSQIHPNAQLAAQAAQAAGNQEKFWEMHDMLFENQNKWSAMSSAGANAEFLKYAISLGINSEWYAGDIDSDEVKKKVADDYKGGVASGVSSTPTFYVNGAKMAHPAGYEAFKQAVLSPAAAVTPTAAAPSAEASPDATP